MSDFEEYLRAQEPGRREKAQLWRTAIGLQKVDGLTPSDYLLETARRNIEGEITLTEAGKIIGEYYKIKSRREEAAKTRTDEADIVSQRIAAILAEPTFSFSPPSYIAIHRKLFSGVYKFAGKIRDYNITKEEWVLRKDTVRYESADMIEATLEYEFERERKFVYKNLNPHEVITHFARFIADLWQIHAFGEGNTRTTAIFAIRYLRMLGFEITNDIFAENSYFFRNALVRANYVNIPKNVHPTLVYLEQFFGNALLGEKNNLQSRNLIISDWKNDNATPASSSVTPTSNETTPTSKSFHFAGTTPKFSRAITKLLKVMEGEISRTELLRIIDIKDRTTLMDYYLAPALKLGLIEMTQPDSPRSPKQKYRLTEKGIAAKYAIGKEIASDMTTRKKKSEKR